MKKNAVSLTTLAMILITNSTSNACESLKNFYSNALWYSNKRLKAIHHVGDLMEGNPTFLSAVKKCHKNCFKMHQYINEASNKEIALITTGLATAAVIGFYVNYKIIHKVSEKIVGCDGNCKKNKDALPNSSNTKK